MKTSRYTHYYRYKLSKEDKGSTIDPFLYKKLVGSLMYLIATRPHITYGVSLISTFMESPKGSHWKKGKRSLRYIIGTIEYGIWYSTSHRGPLIVYIDSDFAGILDDKKSTRGYALQLGTNIISWASRKHPIVSLSSVEEENMETTLATCHAVSLRRVLLNLTHEEEEPTPIFCDKNSSMIVPKNHVFHRKGKHIDTKFHFIHELVMNGEISL